MTDRIVPAAPNSFVPSADRVRVVRGTLAWGVRAVAFWLSIAIPFRYLPLLVRGFSGRDEAIAFVGLLLANVTALDVGHRHRP